ncbi:MAG: hypothetical protein Q9168_006581 [Polycauliona sp. 1 TL-2023]
MSSLATENREDVLSMILVMGVTGAGKSYFINSLADGNIAQTGSKLKSCIHKPSRLPPLRDTDSLLGTVECQAIPVNIGRSKILFIDTPGFDDSARTDSDILTEISRILAAQYQAGLSLKGVIYLHRITDVRYQGSAVKTLNIFKKICGKMALKNVLLVTTRWSEVDESIGASREKELRESFWAYMLGNGSTMTRFYGNRDSATAIASQIISKRSIVLEIQRELVDEGKNLKATIAGAFVQEDITEMKTRYEKEINDLDVLRQTLRDNDRAMRRQLQQDWAREQQRLQTAEEDEERLRRDIAAEVREEIQQKTAEKKSSSVWRMWPLLPSLLGVIEMFVGIAPGSTGLLSSWFTESGIGGSVVDFFQNF